MNAFKIGDIVKFCENPKKSFFPTYEEESTQWQVIGLSKYSYKVSLFPDEPWVEIQSMRDPFIIRSSYEWALTHVIQKTKEERINEKIQQLDAKFRNRKVLNV